MNKKIIGLLVVLCISSLLFAACERSASVTPVTSQPVATQEEIPYPVATQPQIMADILKATQTALALSTQSFSFPSAATSTPGFIINTPAEGTAAAVGGDVTPMSGETPTPTLEAGVTATATSTPVVLATATANAHYYPTPTPGRPATYTLQAGEYLWCLARRFDVNVDDIFALNGMNYASQPQAGTVISIPTSGAFVGTRARFAHPANYTVLPGDTIGSIACYYGDADPNTIYAANGLTPGSVITVGQVLYIP